MPVVVGGAVGAGEGGNVGSGVVGAEVDREGTGVGALVGDEVAPSLQPEATTARVAKTASGRAGVIREMGRDAKGSPGPCSRCVSENALWLMVTALPRSGRAQFITVLRSRSREQECYG